MHLSRCRRSSRAVLVALVCAALPWCPTIGRAAAPAPAAPQAAEAFCSVAVSEVAAIGGDGTNQGVALIPTVEGSGTLSGTIALFTADDRRYDVPFPDTTVTSSGPPAVLRYRFPHPVVVTGAYVAALGGADGGPCTIAYPWSKDRSAASPRAEAAIARAGPAMAALAVTDPGTPDPLACSNPDRPARTLDVAQERSIPYTHGRVTVFVTVAPDGKPVDASVVASDPSLNDGGNGNDARADAVRVALHTVFAPAAFRCRPIIDAYKFVLEYN